MPSTAREINWSDRSQRLKEVSWPIPLPTSRSFASRPSTSWAGRPSTTPRSTASSPTTASTWQTDTEVAGEHLVEMAGRVCYMSFAKPRPGGNQAYLGHILEVGHGSVLEHAVWNFVFTGVSRSLTHELVRHRAGFGYSQLSQRYVDESIAEYVEPDCIADDPELHRLWLDAVADSHQAYMQADREAAESLRGRAGQDAAAQAGPPGRPQRAAQRHRDEDLRHRQRPRPAALHRAARQPPRRGRDPQAGRRGAADHADRKRRTCSATISSSPRPTARSRRRRRIAKSKSSVSVVTW